QHTQYRPCTLNSLVSAYQRSEQIAACSGKNHVFVCMDNSRRPNSYSLVTFLSSSLSHCPSLSFSATTYTLVPFHTLT
ncbi:hypothetical protein STEG23_008844, partial [Scotinomys teguina]